MSPMVVETLKLGIAILNGGNAGVQQVRWHRGMVQRSWGTFIGQDSSHGWGSVCSKRATHHFLAGVCPWWPITSEEMETRVKTTAGSLHECVYLIKRFLPEIKEMRRYIFPQIFRQNCNYSRDVSEAPHVYCSSLTCELLYHEKPHK